MRVEQKSEQEQNTKTSSAEKNVRAFLRLIRYAETGKDDSSAYYVLYGGGTFKNNSAHPLRKAVTRLGKNQGVLALIKFNILHGKEKKSMDWLAILLRHPKIKLPMTNFASEVRLPT